MIELFIGRHPGVVVEMGWLGDGVVSYLVASCPQRLKIFRVHSNTGCVARRGCGLKRLVEAAGALKVSMPADPVFDIACLNEQSRNKDGHEGSSDGVLWDRPTGYCRITRR